MLSAFPLIKTDNFDYARSFHSKVDLHLEPAQTLRAGQHLTTTANMFDSEHFSLYYFNYSESVIIEAPTENPDYWLAVPVQIEKVGEQSVRTTVSRKLSRIASPGRSDPLPIEKDAHSLGLCIKQALIERYAYDFFGDDQIAALVFDHSFDTSRSVEMIIAQLMALIADEEENQGGALESPLRRAHFIETVLSTLLLYHPHSHTTRLKQTSRPIAPRDVKRVLEYIHAFAEHPVSQRDLVKISGVPGRTLNKHFKDFSGLSPMAYLRNVRLHGARKMFQSGHPFKISEVAMHWGFYHLGRFSAYYHRAFGELPSETHAGATGYRSRSSTSA